MSGEPKTLTLEQSYMLNALIRECLDDEWPEGFGKYGYAVKVLREFGESVVRTLGVPVVARDEAAELRAASLELVEAVEGWDDQFGLISMVDGGSPAAEKADAAIARLRAALSGGESER